MVKSRNDGKVSVFDIFYDITQSFFEDIDFKFCTQNYQPLPFNMYSLKKDF